MKPLYPIGQQDFRNLRERGCLYVDKTMFIEKLVHSGSEYYFLARPRRFGKSLFLSTLQYFFQGERHLFKGLDVDVSDWNWDWVAYPVLRIDLNTDKYPTSEKLEEVLDRLFRKWEEEYGVSRRYTSLSQRFGAIIEAAHKKTGRQVVILVDEYDKPLVGNLNKKILFEEYREELAAIYSNLKSSAEHIRFVFLTGVSRFSKLSVFSDLNNLRDITFSDEYADLCGITPQELNEYFSYGIEKLATKEGITFEEAKIELKDNYDGYHFAERGNNIYNPWSVLNALSNLKISGYWNETGMPTIIAESLKRINSNLEEVFDVYCSETELKGFDLLNPNPLALLYQTGYLTIKEYNRKIKRYRLGIPNKEVKSGLFNILLPYYVTCRRISPNELVGEIIAGFILGNPDKALTAMQTYFAGIDYKMKIENENNFHNAFYLLTDLIGLDTSTEVHTSDGSIDLIIRTDDYIYIIELKYDRSAREALQQIEEKMYIRPYILTGKTLFKIGVNFSSKTRCIEDWIIKTGI